MTAQNFFKGDVSLSVLMGTCSRLKVLLEAVESIRSQSFGSWELVLVNDGGPSPELLLSGLNDPRIRLFEQPKRLGKAAAINRAYAESRGRYVAHLDDDDIWLPDHLKTLVDALKATPGARFVFSDATRVDLEPDDEGRWHEVGRSVPYSSDVGLADLLEYNCITGISVLHDRELYSEAGGMDETLDVLLDWDLWRRMAALTPPVHVPRVTAEYFVRSDAGSGQGHITSLAKADPVRYVQNRLRILDKDIPLPSDGSLDAVLDAARARGRMQLEAAHGEQAEASGDLGQAMEHYIRARDHAPQDILPWRKLGLLSTARKDHASALRAFGKCLSLDGALPSDALHASGAALAMGEPTKALGVLDAALRRFGPEDEGYASVKDVLGKVRALAG